ncbi:MAG: putative ribonucleotide transport ATP-binding protein mkl [Phycisphaerales bacterium]|nr:putative ribonucleotide transport ATP-binding protein mkl [Phycisphaerales bacterium]
MHSPGQSGAPSAASAAPPLIRLIDVHKSFGPQRVLEGFNLDIYPGQTTVVLGPSGTGKSVMLKHIVGLLRPDSGQVLFDGNRVDTLNERELKPIRLQVGLLFQMGALFDSMTVEENLEFPMIEHTEMTPEQRRDRAALALDMVDLAGIQDKLPSQLSGGQKKRVALARAIVLQPRVVLYDEPTTGLDPIRADGINELIIKLKRRLKVTSIVVTHDLASARKVADRVVMLQGGKVIADGTYDELTRSADPHVQHFLLGQYDRDEDTATDSFSVQQRPPLSEAI